jgi:phosphatidylserine/phosphatidylglycerophosphate/cardiolipin synthase-like enzyme
VRWLADAKFAKTYPELLERFARAGVEVRRFDAGASLGGVLHAKYFLADGQAYLGSQNFDWRSLEHIQELGVHVAVPEVVRALSDVFELDWGIAGGSAGRPAQLVAASVFPVVADGARVTFVASPTGWLPDERLWELPALVKLVDSAHRTVRVQLLTYRAHGGRSGDFPELEDALKRAAGRGVRVELLVSHWSEAPETLAGLKSLFAPPALEVRFLTVPSYSGGFIPFARVAHAKYLVVDGERAWVGTSNWERDYFYASRNVGLIVEGGALPARLDAYFAGTWGSPYAEPLDPARAYPAPRVGQ